MTAQLPGAFARRMKELLGPEYEQFTDTYQQSPYGGIRVNTLKITVDGLRGVPLHPGADSLVPFGLLYRRGSQTRQTSLLSCRAVLYSGAECHGPG